MPIDRTSDAYRIERLEKQVIALRGILQQSLRLLHGIVAQNTQPYNSDCLECRMLKEYINQLEQITPYSKR